MLFTSKRLWAASLSHSHYPQACWSFHQWVLVSVFVFLFLIGRPIAIWFDTDLSKTDHKGGGTRQLTVYGPPSSKEVLDEAFHFSPWSASSEQSWNWHGRLLLAFGRWTAPSLNSECGWGERVCVGISLGEPEAVPQARVGNKSTLWFINSPICGGIRRRRRFQLVGGPWKRWNSISAVWLFKGFYSHRVAAFIAAKLILLFLQFSKCLWGHHCRFWFLLSAQPNCLSSFLMICCSLP